MLLGTWEKVSQILGMLKSIEGGFRLKDSLN